MHSKNWQTSIADYSVVSVLPCQLAMCNLYARATGLSAIWCRRANQSIKQSINQFTFSVLRTHQGSQQTITAKILRMLSLNETSHSMLFWATNRSNFVIYMHLIAQ